MTRRTSQVSRAIAGALLVLAAALGPAGAEPPPDTAPAGTASGDATADAPSGAPSPIEAAGEYILILEPEPAPPPEAARFAAGRSVALVTRDRIAEAQVRSAPELLEGVPGVLVQQTNRGAGAPILRGLVGPQNLILVDGIPFTTSTHRTGPNQYLSLVDPFALRRVEVVRGPSSVLYGSGAMGGVLQLLTIEPRVAQGPPSLGGEARTLATTADLGRGLAARVEPRGGAAAGVAALHLDWFDTLRTGGGVEQPLSSYLAGYWQAKAAYEPRPGWRLTGAYLGAILRDASRTDAAGKGDLRVYDNDDHLVYLAASRAGPGAVRQTVARAYYHQLAERVDRYGCATSGGIVVDLDACLRRDVDQLASARRYRDTVHVLGGNAATEIAVRPSAFVVRAGLEARHELVGSSQLAGTAANDLRLEPARGTFADGSTFTSLGLFAHGDVRLVELGRALGRLQLTTGARATHTAAFAPDVEGFGDVRYDHQGLVGSVGVQLLRPARHNVYVTFLQGFRPPNLQETTAVGDTGQKFAVPNPDLGPERSNTVEAGAKLAVGDLALEGALFGSRNTDAIVWADATWQGQAEIGGKPVIRQINATRGIFLGAEGALAYRLGRLTLSTSAAWLRGDVQLADGAEVPAQRVPPAFGATAIRYDHPGGRVSLEATVRWAARQDRLHPEDRKDLRICETGPFSGVLEDPCDGTPGWAALDLRGALRLSRRVTAHLQLANVTDERYRTHGSGVDAPGLDARLTLQAAL